MKIIKELDGKYYLSLSKVVVENIQYTNFIECDKDGNIKDFDGNGRIDGFTIKCDLHETEEIDVSKLSDSCFTKNIE